MTPDRFYTPDELAALSTEELQALWDAVPTDRQRAYKQAYDREIASAGATHSDAAEKLVLDQLKQRYADDGLIPLGARWARTPTHIRQAVEAGTPVTSPTATPPPARIPSRVIAAGLLGLVILLGLLLSRGGSSDERVTVAENHTPTPDTEPTITPTPILLDNTDDVVGGGDAERSTLYPIKLTVHLPDQVGDRVWVVQRRGIKSAQWHFEPDPDVASYLNGMTVKPVIGLPWSDETDALFTQITAGTRFTLTLNTGATREFVFAHARSVQRTDTDALRQTQPGLVLVMLGDADGLSNTRRIITADYVPDDVITNTLPTVAPTGGFDVQLIAVTTQAGRLTAHLRLINVGQIARTITPETVQLSRGYASEPAGPWYPADGLTPFRLEAGQAVDLLLVWTRADEPFAVIDVAGFRYALDLHSRR